MAVGAIVRVVGLDNAVRIDPCNVSIVVAHDPGLLVAGVSLVVVDEEELFLDLSRVEIRMRIPYEADVYAHARGAVHGLDHGDVHDPVVARRAVHVNAPYVADVRAQAGVGVAERIGQGGIAVGPGDHAVDYGGAAVPTEGLLLAQGRCLREGALAGPVAIRGIVRIILADEQLIGRTRGVATVVLECEGAITATQSDSGVRARVRIAHLGGQPRLREDDHTSENRRDRPSKSQVSRVTRSHDSPRYADDPVRMASKETTAYPNDRDKGSEGLPPEHPKASPRAACLQRQAGGDYSNLSLAHASSFSRASRPGELERERPCGRFGLAPRR